MAGRGGLGTSLVWWGDKTLVSREEETSQVSHVGSRVEFWCGEGFVADVGGQAVVDDVAEVAQGHKSRVGIQFFTMCSRGSMTSKL